MTDIPTTSVMEKSAWTAAELRADAGWVRQLSGAELEALDSAAADLASRGLAARAFTREDVAAPVLAELADLADWATAELERGRGCVLIKGLEVARHARARIEAMYWLLGLLVGEPRHQNAEGDLLTEVRDHGLHYRDPLVRGYKTRQTLNFHCDGLDLVSLLCLQPAKSGGESQIASSVAVFNEILATRPDYLPPLFEGFHYNLRGEGEPGETYPVTRHKVPVYSWYDGRLSCRYIRKAIVEGQKFVGAPVTDLAKAALDGMQELCASDTFRYDMTFEPGDIQILNNHVVLHSRAEFEDWPEAARKRNLLRLWMNARGGRRLEPRFADRYNMGPREPMRVKASASAA